MKRRNFLTAAVSSAAALAGDSRPAAGEHPVPVRNPRATSGDALEPEWKERLTITVGPGKADLAGSTEKVVQAAVDSIARWGGGTVRILPGTYRFRNAVYLQSNVRILGSGLDSVIVKEPMIAARLSQDSDWFDQEITFASANGLQVGDGICLRVKNMSTGGVEVVKRTLVARNGNRFKLDSGLRKNVWLMGEPKVESLFPLFSGENISGVAFENIALDGNKANNANLDGNYAGCIWMQDCNRITIRQVTARNYNGDGISWQICHDVLAEDCHSHDHAGLGLHPGSGSQRSVIRRNRMVGNDQGLFFCWGVRWALAEKNYIEGSRRYGISIGHHDTDNIVRENEIRTSSEVGILFRKERTAAFQGNRNVIEKNRILGIRKENGIGIDVQGQTQSIKIIGNEIRETQAPSKRVGIRIGPDTEEITVAGNRIDGFFEPVLDLRKKG
ncbi:MAG TPA: right-handed parallel beta-helix repeat-containing protein [Bryobacteraceae bacterium]|nr:right-handed parallel beta-helix repeat-containing protein [Bryobacteraceae bacterium]